MKTMRSSNQRNTYPPGKLIVIVCTLFAGLSVHGPAALADGAGTADVVESNMCMQETAGFGLNCTANDVQLASARNITIHDADGGCAFPGDTVTFTADFEIMLTARERHDVGIWFATDGDPNGDGALTGACHAATPPYGPEPYWLDLDGMTDSMPGTNISAEAQDTCGDIDNAHSPMFPEITMTVACVDSDNDGMLNLPNCTSWRQPGSNDYCDAATGAFPGSPSKCRCDLSFNIGIEVPPAELLVTKTPSDSTVLEPGKSDVVFTVTVKNTSIDPENSVDLDTLTDTVYGNLLDSSNPKIANNDCDDKVANDPNLGADETLTCSFEAAVMGNAGYIHENTVMASGLDQRNPPNRISGEDDATVTIIDRLPGITVDKSASPTNILEPGGQVSFTVTVNNTSPASSDPVTINSLTDESPSPGGPVTDLNGMGTCTTPQIIEAGGSYSCSFDLQIVGNAGDSETDLVTASGSDDDGNAVTASDDATVSISDSPSAIEIIKTATPEELEEPVGNVTFNLTVNNLSSVDSVTIDSLSDTVFGDLDGFGDCSVPQTILPGNSYSCSFMSDVEGEPAAPHMNVATASGFDDDGNPVSDDDGATVNFNNVPPAASLSKAATQATVTYAVSVQNDSDAEALTLESLYDDKFGDIADINNLLILSTSCSVPQLLEPSDGEDGGLDEYNCQFTAVVNCSSHTNTLTGTVSDNDGSTPAMPTGSATVSLTGASECPPDI